MNSLREIVFVALVGALLLATTPQAVLAQTMRSELVAIDGSHNRFRLVGHGTFTAPPHVSVAALDGKTVEVEFSGGRVVDIHESPVAIQPIISNREIVLGQLQLRDAAMGTFSLAGENRVYVAPASIDLRPYAGRMVEVHLDERGQLSRIDLAAHSGVPAPRAGSTCIYGGESYSDGAAVCQSGTQYVCEIGTWRSLGLACSGTVSGPPCDFNGLSYTSGTTRCERGTQFICETGLWRNIGTACVSDSTAAVRSPRTCMFGGATVMNGSSICRDGTAMRCSDGEWISDGTPCR